VFSVAAREQVARLTAGRQLSGSKGEAPDRDRAVLGSADDGIALRRARRLRAARCERLSLVVSENQLAAACVAI